MVHYQYKNISDSVKDVDAASRKVKVAISHLGSIDFDNDVIDGNAYTKTLKERGPQGANLIWHLTDHNPSLKSAIGKFSELNVEGDYLVGVTNIPNTTWGNDVLEFYKSGHINQHSVGFRTVKAEQEKSGDVQYNRIKEIMLYEGSAVLWGANINTPTIEAGKSLAKEDADTLNNELNLLSKSLKDGRFTDEGFELIEIRFKQVQEKISYLLNKFTQPVQAVEPTNQMEKLKEAINLITIKNFAK